MHTATSRHGMTMLELIIATSILAVLMGAVFSALHLMTRDMQGEITSSVLNQETARSLEKLMEKLRGAWIESLADAGAPTADYFVPVDTDKDGDVLDADLAIDWGQDGPNGEKQDAVTRIRFVKSTVYSEKISQYDLNQDGDMNDSFDVGHMEEAFYSTSTITAKSVPDSIRALTPDIVLQKAGIAVGDVDGDGTDDPIFQETENMLQIRLFVSRTDERNPRFERFATSVLLRNW